ncbi:ROK family protein [Micrococcales bacterium 31B]|nr:ROK family protein [Micrococcales bacterium 31B]
MTSDIVLALDVGGTDTKMAVFGEHPEEPPLLTWTAPTRASEGPDIAFATLVENARVLLRRASELGRVVGGGLAVPGIIDEGAELLINAENLGWRDRRLGAELSDALGVPFNFGHDVRTGGLAEWKLGAGRGESDLVFVPIGTGIASALVLNDRLIDAHGFAGEVGHGGFVEGPDCPCGGRGCPERTASAAAIARRYTERTGRPAPGAVDVLRAMHEGNADAAAVWHEAVEALGQILTAVVRVTGVPLAIIGGGLAQAGADLFDPLGAAIDRRLTVHRRPRLVPAQLGKSAGVRGAGLLGWRAAREA